MRKLSLILAAALLAPVGAVGTAAAQVARPASGRVQMTVHTHSAGVLLFPVERLPFNFTTGDTFSYSSRLCRGNAPFNDVGLNFTPDYPGVDDDADDTAPSRHHVEGTVTRAQGRRGTISGTITTVLCVPGPDGAQTESPHAIVWHFKAAYVLAAPNDLHIYGGFQFSPTESTGTFRDLRGGGRIEGRFTCLGLASCAPRGEFTDFVVSTGDPTLPAGQLRYGATGTYSDPTVLPVG